MHLKSQGRKIKNYLMHLKSQGRKIKNYFRSEIKKNNNRFYSCNLCGWKGKKFSSNKWHKYSTCPNCESDVRHRLFVACLEHYKDIGIDMNMTAARSYTVAIATLHQVSYGSYGLNI